MRRHDRRHWLRQASGTAVIGAVGGSLLSPPRLESAPKRSRRTKRLDVRDFGARGDGRSDDTDAFRKAIEAASDLGGDIVSVPHGDYLIAGTLEVPPCVTIEGVFRAPTTRSQRRGTTLLAVSGSGSDSAAPLITLRENSTLRGLTIYYPEQRRSGEPTPYPWSVRVIGDNCTLIDLLLVNPFQALDLATFPSGRHFIRGVYGQPLYRGIAVDRCFDVGRIENVHFWPFWEDLGSDAARFALEKGVAFTFGRTDWEYLHGCFCLGYRIGFHFLETSFGSANALLVQCGSDLGPLAARIDASQPHAGLSFVNGQFMAGIETGTANLGPIKFTACGFWGMETTGSHAVLGGAGQTHFVNCHFIDWARQTADAPAIEARRGGLIVTACDFMAEGRTQLRLAPEIETAIVFGNRFRGGEKIINEAGERAQMGMNAATAVTAPSAISKEPARVGWFDPRRLPRWRA